MLPASGLLNKDSINKCWLQVGCSTNIPVNVGCKWAAQQGFKKMLAASGLLNKDSIKYWLQVDFSKRIPKNVGSKLAAQQRLKKK